MDIGTWLDTAERRERVDKRMSALLRKDFGMGMLDYRALRAVAESEDGELRMQGLARKLGVNQSSITRMVPRLEERGYAYRDLCPEDSRGAYCVITEKGRGACGEMTESLDRLLVEVDGDW
ncbi:MarR family winged helix-turn-helix transcriptional regulator [Salininema proteolyticum]|uniref:MarR family winged helix-turn-helix transcriptional regulator n=1 Tax=Salininema proteolyticum TaxID=1607685 RepID=A0ABV8TY51_9ACTN